MSELRRHTTTETDYVPLVRNMLSTMQTDSTASNTLMHPNSNAGNMSGTGTSALRLSSYALAILRCWQAISTGSGAGTPPPVHTATALMRRQSTWCSGVQLMTRPEETSGWQDHSTRTHDASGSSWSGLGRWPPMTGNVRERVTLDNVVSWRRQYLKQQTGKRLGMWNVTEFGYSQR